ncbi:MAG: 3-keto-disaccharide hydrolase [Opitutaceae bacterium]
MKRLAPTLLCGAVAAALIACAADDDSNLPPPEETEYYSPVPPIVRAPADAPPSDALVLFDGSSMDAWETEKPDAKGWKIEDGALVVVPKQGTLRTKQAFGDVQVHIEWRAPADDDGEGQKGGNSGVFLMGRYELQVLNSHENPTYVNGQAGSIYKQHPPLVNASRPRGEWQTYDIVFVAPRFGADGKVVSPARMTAFHNGVLVQRDAVLKGDTVWRGAPKYTAHPAKLPIELQDHGDLVAYRNIWVREISLPEGE